MEEQEISNLPDNNFVLPTEYTPGNDVIWSVILSDQRIIDTIVKSLVNLPKNSYVSTPIKLSNNEVYNIFYAPSSTQNSLPPILVNIIKKLGAQNMYKIIQQCTELYEYFGCLPICLIISQHELDESFINGTTYCKDLSILREIKCAFWAERCFLLSENDIHKEEANDHPLLKVLAAINYYKKVILSTS